MKLFSDECVYQKTVVSIREWGHDIITAWEVGLSGKSDDEILEYAVKEKRILITADLDFSNVRHYPPSDHWGIIVLKIKPSILPNVHNILRSLLQQESQEYFSNALIVVDRNKYRLRRAG